MNKLSVMSKLQDEEPDVGIQVSEAMAPIVEKMGQDTARMAQVISKALTDAIIAIDTKPITVETAPVRGWTFTFERNKDGLITKINAEAR